MENISILMLIAEYGTPAILAIAIIYILWLIISGFASAKLKNFFSGKEEHEEFNSAKRKEELKHHIFFKNAEYRMIAEIPSLDLLPTKPNKEKMFRDLILLHTKVIYDTCQEIIQHDLESMTPEEWATYLSETVTDMITVKADKSKEAGFPDIIITKYSKIHNRRFEDINEYIFLLSVSPYYDNNIARTNTFLLMMNLFLVTVLADSERMIRDLNGSISGTTYKGLVLED